VSRLKSILTPERMVWMALVVIAASLVLIPVAFLTRLAYSVAFVTLLSLVALTLAGIAWLAGALADLRSPDG
jgi:hypothetical protein